MNKVLEAAEENYMEARRNEPLDLRAATTLQQIAAIQNNLNSAYAAYLEALAIELKPGNAAIEATYPQVQQALSVLRQARQREAGIAEVINDLSEGTAAVQKLIALA